MRPQARFRVLLLPIFIALASCGGGDGGGGNVPSSGGNGGATGFSNFGTSASYKAGVFQPSANFSQRCATPRLGTTDRQGTTTDQNNWLRSWTNELYLWYSEVPDLNPSLYTDTEQYFSLMKTSQTTSSGQPKDKFHFTYDTDEWEALSQGGTEAGYGASFEVLEGYPPRDIRVSYIEPGSNGGMYFARGDVILQADGVDAVNGNTKAIVDTLNAALFPATTGESHTFVVSNTLGQRTVTVTSTTVTHVPVAVTGTLPGNVGYILFNDHIGPGEGQLINAVNTLKSQAITDLILDLRYNGGGYLDMASELAYMIGNTTLTAGKTFEKTVFNDKNPSKDPVTGEILSPTPFHTKSLGFPGSSVAAGVALPTLNLNRVYIITGSGTCSASEAIINALRGVDVEVYIIGSTTCGKPYGFYPTDNCGTTYFSIQFEGENAKNFGSYSDGFSPANQTANKGVSVPGCSVADDFSNFLGSQNEARIAAALSFRASNNQTCPAATGSSSPRLSKTSNDYAGRVGLAVTKPPTRTNRFVRF